MNQQQALAQARKRWGKNARVEERKCGLLERRGKFVKRTTGCSASECHGRRCPGGRAVFYVGRVISVVVSFFEILGAGNTWEEALSREERRQERERWARIDAALARLKVVRP